MNEKQKNDAIRKGLLQRNEYRNKKRDVNREVGNITKEIDDMAYLPPEDFKFDKFSKKTKDKKKGKTESSILNSKINELEKVTEEIAMSVGDFDGQMDFFNEEGNIKKYLNNPDEYIQKRIVNKKAKNAKTKSTGNKKKGQRVPKKSS